MRRKNRRIDIPKLNHSILHDQIKELCDCLWSIMVNPLQLRLDIEHRRIEPILEKVLKPNHVIS